MTNQRRKPDNTGVVRNIRGFVSAYLKSDSGKAALARRPIRVKDRETGKMNDVWRSSQMADAFQQAIA